MYFITMYPGLDQNAAKRVLTLQQYQQLAYLDRTCQGELELQRPSAFSEVLHTTIVGAFGGGVGYGAGYAASGLGPVGDGAVLGAVAGGVGGFVGGLDGRGRAKRYDIGQCMTLSVHWAQQLDHQLMGVGVVINSHAVNGKGIERPAAVAANDNAPMAASDNGSAAAANGTTGAPPPVIP